MKKENTIIKGILFYNLFFIIAAIGFYFLIPIMMNYPPNSINNEFEMSIDQGMSYNSQYGMIILFAMIIFNSFFIRQMYQVGKYKNYIDKDDEISKEKLEKIKRKCFSSPYQIYAVHAAFPSIMVAIILCLTGAEITLTLKIVLLIFIFTIVLGLLAYISSKEIFNEVLVDLKNEKKYRGLFKVNFKGKIFLLIFPLIFAAILFSAFSTNTLLSRERGEFIFENYNTQITSQDYTKVSTLDEIIEKLKKIKKHSENDTLFIITQEQILYSDNSTDSIDEFFRKYTFSGMGNGRTYGYYATPIQGAYVMCNLDGEKVAAGIMYSTEEDSAFAFIACTVGVLLLICAIFLHYFSKDIGSQIVVVSKKMRKLANEETIDYNQKIAVLSNDEVGDLTISFNKILDLERKHVNDMERNQEILVEQERLSSLGQMIGGIAHNLKTPIMSISGASQAIKDLIKEYDMSISNSEVTPEDHHEIAKEMEDWNSKIKVYLEYMTEIIDAAKGQAVSMNASTITEFSIEELIARVKILMKEQLMHRNCKLNLNIDVDKNTYITGEISALIQVLNNLIINAIDAYENAPGEINLMAYSKDENIYIIVEDFAGGIPESVQKKLFKQMITTKGKAGTGLGLYMCYSTIKGKFNGEMSFETEVGKGTRFIIVLNKKQ